MEKDPMIKAAGFKMNNLKTFPFARLPKNFQVEVIEKISINERIELFNVTSGFRGFFARNGVFGKDVDSISLSQIMLKDGEKNELRISVKIDDQNHDFHILKYRALFRHIRRCFCIELNYRIRQPLDELMEAKADIKIGDWFPNLRFVKYLRVYGWGHPFVEGMLESFHFKVTNIASFRSAYLQLSESRHWGYLFKNQLSNCSKVIIASRVLIDEIPGMEIEEDRDKCAEILDAFRKEGAWLGEIPGSAATHPAIQYYRRKITDNKEMLVMVVANRD